MQARWESSLSFRLPLLLDAFRGQQSNLHLILGHLFQHSADHKTFFQSLTYFATFLCYIPNPETICDHLTSSRVLVLALITWSGIGILATVLTRIGRGKQNAAERRFSYWLRLWFGLGADWQSSGGCCKTEKCFSLTRISLSRFFLYPSRWSQSPYPQSSTPLISFTFLVFSTPLHCRCLFWRRKIGTCAQIFLVSHPTASMVCPGAASRSRRPSGIPN